MPPPGALSLEAVENLPNALSVCLGQTGYLAGRLASCFDGDLIPEHTGTVVEAGHPAPGNLLFRPAQIERTGGRDHDLLLGEAHGLRKKSTALEESGKPAGPDLERIEGLQSFAIGRILEAAPPASSRVRPVPGAALWTQLSLDAFAAELAEHCRVRNVAQTVGAGLRHRSRSLPATSCLLNRPDLTIAGRAIHKMFVARISD